MALELDENQPSEDAVILPGASAPLSAPPAAPLARAPAKETRIDTRPIPVRDGRTRLRGLASRRAEIHRDRHVRPRMFLNAEAAFAAHVGPHGVTRVGYFGGVVRPDGRTFDAPRRSHWPPRPRRGGSRALRPHGRPFQVPRRALSRPHTIPRSRKLTRSIDPSSSRTTTCRRCWRRRRWRTLARRSATTSPPR